MAAKATWLGVWLPVCLLAQGGNAPLVLRSETRAVAINVVVRNRAGDPIADLRPEDFTIFDDGQPRPVQIFSMEGGAAATVSGRTPTRITAIVLDALNTDFSDQSYAQDQAIKAVGRMQAGESIAILHLAPGLAFQNFTRDRSALLAAIHRFQPILPPYAMKQSVQVTVGALKTLADRMSKAAGRKTIVWITGGIPPVRVWQNAIDEMLRKIDMADVAIYPVDARGLMLGMGGNFEMLDKFAEVTGGQAYYNGNDVAGATERAISDWKSTYVIGFYLADGERDRRFHTLHVEVNRPGATLRYRRGFSPTVAR